MKKIWITIGMVLLAVGLCAALAGCDSYVKQDVYANADEYRTGTQVYEGELSELDVEWILGNITLVEDENATNVTVVEENELSSRQKVHTLFKDGVLHVNFWESGYRAKVESKYKKVTITYPSVKRIRIDTVSADIEGNALNADLLNIKTVSGDLRLSSANVKEMDVETVSGDVKTGSVVAPTFSMKTVSGEVEMDSLSTSSAVCETVSGDVKIPVCTAETFSFDGTSADCTVGFVAVGTVTHKSVSGDLDVTLPLLGGTITFETTSGKIESNKSYVRENDTYRFGVAPTCTIRSKTTSGNVYVR